MTEPRQRRVGAYAKLLANYASDDAIIDAGEKAELLFVRGLAFLATSDSDGYITDAQVVRYVGAGMRDAVKRAQRLVEVGLWDRIDGGYHVRSWIKYHESAEEKGRKKRTDRERKRGHRPEGIQEDSEWNPDGIQESGDTESLLCSYVSSNQPTEQDTTPHHTTPQGRAATPDEEYAEPPRHCPDHPNGTKAKCGPCRDARLRWEQWRNAEPQRLEQRRISARIRRSLCQDCDADGWLLNHDGTASSTRCTHPDVKESA